MKTNRQISPYTIQFQHWCKPRTRKGSNVKDVWCTRSPVVFLPFKSFSEEPVGKGWCLSGVCFCLSPVRTSLQYSSGLCCQELFLPVPVFLPFASAPACGRFFCSSCRKAQSLSDKSQPVPLRLLRLSISMVGVGQVYTTLMHPAVKKNF